MHIGIELPFRVGLIVVQQVPREGPEADRSCIPLAVRRTASEERMAGPKVSDSGIRIGCIAQSWCRAGDSTDGLYQAISCSAKDQMCRRRSLMLQ